MQHTRTNIASLLVRAHVRADQGEKAAGSTLYEEIISLNEKIKSSYDDLILPTIKVCASLEHRTHAIDECVSLTVSASP